MTTRTGSRILLGGLVLAVAAIGAPVVVSDGATSTPSIVGVTTGTSSSCALLSDGTVECWGSNELGELGASGAPATSTPVAVSGVTGAMVVTAGAVHTCALIRGGTVMCWGNGSVGQLGNGTMTGLSGPVAVSGLSNAVDVSAGALHTCAVINGGTVQCWGDNSAGELGDGTTTDSSKPVAVAGLSNVTEVSAGLDSTCALQSAGTVVCWGDDDGTGADNPMPTPVPSLGPAVAVSSGYLHSCALMADTTVECWGINAYGEVGDGTTNATQTPVAVSGLRGVTALSAGYFDSCAVLSDHSARCWGHNTSGQLGDGTATDSTTPVVVRGLTTARAISAGNAHTCATVTGGGAACWGENNEGDLGDGTHVDHPTPVAVLPPTPPTPVFGKSETVQVVSGTVLVQLPGTHTFVPLSSVKSVPVGTTINTTNGMVKLTSATDSTGHPQTGLFYSGVFKTGQQKGPSPLHKGKTVGFTVLSLAGSAPSGCGSHGRAAAARGKRSAPRSLWGNAKGNYRTVGQNASATVRGTKWFTQDSCAGTLVRVARGVVSVSVFATHRTVLVRAPHSFLAPRHG